MSTLSYTQLQARGKVTLCPCISVETERRKKPCTQGRGENICLVCREGALMGGGYAVAMAAPGWPFFHRSRWVFLYLGQDFSAKICLMNKPPGLPPKPVSFHNHFLWTGGQYFCEGPFVMCLFFFLSFPLFHSGAPWPLVAVSRVPGRAQGGLAHTERVSEHAGVMFISLESFLKTFDSCDMKLVTK